MLRVAAFTGGRHVPSARFRVRQYTGILRTLGIEISEYAAPLGSYPPRSKFLRPLWAFGSLASRLPQIAAGYRCDMSILQREMISTIPTLEGFVGRPRVLDVDDAIWLYRSGVAAKKLASASDAVVCGNEYLANHFSHWSPNIHVVPTAVDSDRFTPVGGAGNPVIGWSGTSGGFKYLYSVEKALCEILRSMPDVRLRIVSNSRPQFKILPSHRIDYIEWSPGIEVTAIQGMSVGIMPLIDSAWERGKCSYKMLTYMACGKPVVVSPVGMNVSVLAKGYCGVAADRLEDWTEALLHILSNPSKQKQMGEIGRRIIEQHYSLDVVAPLLASIFRSVR